MSTRTNGWASEENLRTREPEECLVREVREETGLTLTDYAYRGLVTFVSDRWETEYMHLFTGTPSRTPVWSVMRGTWSGWIRTR